MKVDERNFKIINDYDRLKFENESLKRDIAKLKERPLESQELPAEVKPELKEIKEQVLEQYKNGNIVVAGFEGLEVYSLKEFMDQPVDGMLYDLNRNEAVVLTFINDPKWVNDFAVCKVIRELKRQLDESSQPHSDIVSVTDSEIEKEIYEILNKTLHFMDHDRKRTSKGITVWLRDRQRMKLRDILIKFTEFLTVKLHYTPENRYIGLIDEFIQSLNNNGQK